MTSSDGHDPFREEDGSPDPVDVWPANRPFEAIHLRGNPYAASAKQSRIAELRFEIARLEGEAASAAEKLTARRSELAHLG
jgi:hypothetical protein